MTAPLYTIDTLPADAQAAIREFDDRYLAMLGVAPPPAWTGLGALIPTNAPMMTFPVGSFGLKYERTQGESRFKTFQEKTFDLKTEEFDEGYWKGLKDILQNPWAYQEWLKGPERLMIAEAELRNDTIAELLEDGENQKWGGSKPIDGRNFFSATHLSDFTKEASTKWSNYQSAAKSVLSIPNLQAEVTIMQGVLNENGKKVGADPKTILVPTAKYEALKNLLAKELILDSGGAAGTTNPYRNRFNVVHVPEFTDEDDWYLVDEALAARTGLPPWISLRDMTLMNPLALRYYDETSDYFKDTGNLKATSHVWYGFSLGFPHCIRKVKGA